MRPPAGFARPDAEDSVEETAVPGQPDGERLVERITAAAAEMAHRVVALAALAADQVTSVAPSRSLERARRRTGPGDSRRHRAGSAGDRLVCGGDRRWWRGCDRSADAGQHRRGRRSRCYLPPPL